MAVLRKSKWQVRFEILGGFLLTLAFFGTIVLACLFVIF